ncbi:MAG: carboxynorspermidine decarboxylase [Eubacteriales bacterium]|nr:carboxynorspermidine decarboxylase [Eubacteriales bacterium]
MEEREIFRGLAGLEPIQYLADLPTPGYLIDEKIIRENGECLAAVAAASGAKILLAQKAFSNYDFYPLLSQYLAGTEASGLFEARLGREKMPEKEVHVFCGAYRESEIEEVLRYADHIVFNSPHQLKRFGARAKAAGKSVGLRINPQHSTQDGHGIYDPCAPGSRLGTTREQFDACMTQELIALLDGLHFHTLCEQGADDLLTTWAAVEAGFSDILPKLQWINMGGGHHITRSDYDRQALIDLVRRVRERWALEVYLEPGEAVALNAGYFLSRVLDVVTNGETQIAMLDASAACHMPDVLEMPYQPPLLAAKKAGFAVLPLHHETGAYTYTLGGPTCLSGDVMGAYTFRQPLREGDLLIFGDMAIYTTCKNNTFNGMPLPAIFRLSESGEISLLRSFDYQDFHERLGS